MLPSPLFLYDETPLSELVASIYIYILYIIYIGPLSPESTLIVEIEDKLKAAYSSANLDVTGETPTNEEVQRKR